MQTAIISIVYHSSKGHTAQLAALLAHHMQTPQTAVQLMGDKLNTLQSMMLFAAQHSMHWISLGVLPRFLNDEQTDGQNRLASYIGLMTQCDNGCVVHPLHPGDALTAELFAQRIVETTLHFKNIKITNNVTSTN